MAKGLDCSIDVNEFKIQSYSYVHFRTNIFGKGIDHFNPSGMAEIALLLFFYKDAFNIK